MHVHAASVYYGCMKIDFGQASRSNETSEQISTRTARLRLSSSSFSRPLEENSYRPLYSTNLPLLERISDQRALTTGSVDLQLPVLDDWNACRDRLSVAR